MSDRPVTDYERREDQAIDPEPDFVDVHVTLDWVIRVHGQTDAEAAKDIAIDYLADQRIEQVVELIAHEDGVLCDGDQETGLDENGNLTEEELTLALYPEDGPALPTNIPVAVATYHNLRTVGVEDLRS
jgi:hypothetical protein